MRPLKKINIIETKEEEHITTTENKRKKIVYICKKEYMRENTARDIIEKLKQAEKEIDRGEGISSDEAFKELRQEFGYWFIQSIEKVDELKRQYRRITIDNYIILYTIAEEINTVYVAHMYYGGRNYLENHLL